MRKGRRSACRFLIVFKVQAADGVVAVCISALAQHPVGDGPNDPLQPGQQGGHRLRLHISPSSLIPPQYTFDRSEEQLFDVPYRSTFGSIIRQNIDGDNGPSIGQRAVILASFKQVKEFRVRNTTQKDRDTGHSKTRGISWSGLTPGGERFRRVAQQGCSRATRYRPGGCKAAPE